MMQMKHRYDDPTGGGDDITVTAPVWVDVPSTFAVRDQEGNRLVFDLAESEADDAEDED